MKGNILTEEDRKYIKFIARPFSIVIVIMWFFSIPLALWYIFEPDTWRENFDGVLPSSLAFYVCIFLGSLLLYFIADRLIPKLMKLQPLNERLKNVICVGTRIKMQVSEYKTEYYKTGTKTTYYYNFIPVASYDDISKSSYTHKYETTATVIAVDKRGFKINGGEKIKFSKLYLGRIYVGGKSVDKMDIVM